MSPKRRFTLIYAPIVHEHLRSIERKYYSLIRKTIEEQLQFTPDAETRNRKPLLRPIEFEATWELRLGPNNRFRVFYEIDFDSQEVYILVIGVKRGNLLLIGGETVK